LAPAANEKTREEGAAAVGSPEAMGRRGHALLIGWGNSGERPGARGRRVKYFIEKQDIIIRSVNLVKIAIEAEILRQGTHRNSYWRRAI
jgi:hypothetical protein